MKFWFGTPGWGWRLWGVSNGDKWFFGLSIKQGASDDRLLAQQPAATGEESSKGADVAQPKRRRYGPSGSLSEYGIFPECDAQQPADDEVVFIDGVGAGRSSVKSCHDGVQWIMVGDRVYWPLSDSDAKRLQSACCGNGSFDDPAAALATQQQELTT